MKYLFPGCLILLITSCQTAPDSDRQYTALDKNKIYKLGLNPTEGSKYYYDISNESEFELEVEDKKTENLNKTNVGIYYKFDKDSTGNYFMTINYDKIRIYSKNGDKETDLDAANANVSFNPFEKMLGELKDAKIVATITPAGEIKTINGYKEIGEKILSQIDLPDIHARNTALDQWNKLIGEGLVKKNINELFRLFPDSAIHLGDTWKLDNKQTGEIDLISKNIYTLKDIQGEVAIIESEGKIISANTSNSVMGYKDVSANLDGKQQGEYEIDTKTGMLISCKTKTNVKGTIQVSGTDVPVTIKSSVTMKGRKLE